MHTITILNMAEYNPRADRKKHSWFRVDNTVAFSPKFARLDAEQRWFFLFLVSLASFNQSETIKVDLEYFELHSKVKKTKIIEAIQLLAEIGSISVTERGQAVSTGADRFTTLQTNITNKQTPQPAPSAPEFDFETPFQEYPRKVGKGEGMHRLRRRIRDPETYAKFCQAVRAYASECRLQRVDPKYIKHWSSFVGTDEKEPWRDYIPVKREQKHFPPSQSPDRRYDEPPAPRESQTTDEGLKAAKELSRQLGLVKGIA